MASSRFVLGVILSGGFHVLAYVQMSHAKASVHAAPPPPVVIEVETAESSHPPTPPPPPPAVVKEDEPAPVNPAPAPVAKEMAPKQTNAAPPPPDAAQAGKVLAAEDDAPGVADFTMVQGTGATFAGGVTTSNGTSKRAVEGAPRAAAAMPVAMTGGGGGTGGGGVDRSKPARPVGSDWDCKSLFPSTANVDNATVIIVARVRADGAPESVTVVSDPGQGFGPAARACAMRQRYAAAEDRDGRAIAASTAPFRVRFTR